MIVNQAQQEFIVTARKWRPLRFDSVVGQEHITGTLRNAISSNRIHHAYLFCGPRGVGKTTTARILARAVNCLEPEGTEPCNKCTNCTSTLAGRSLDIIEIDGASNNSVDDVRKLRENARYQPSLGKYKMYIIDEVHMLSTSAFNALLKILEEPPSHLLFVFATTESHKVPATIISRCQRFDFRRMEIADIVSQLKYISEKEEIQIDEESLVTIAKKGDGSMRDSQSIFDQVRAFCGNIIIYSEMASALHLIDEEFFFRITDSIAEKNAAQILDIAAEVISRGYELQETLQGLLEHFRNILTVVVTNDTKLINTSSSFLSKYKSTASNFSKANLLRYLQIINTTEQALKYLPQPRIRFELALVSMAEMDTAADIKELIEEIRSLKSGGPLPTSMTSSKQALIDKETQSIANKPSDTNVIKSEKIIDNAKVNQQGIIHNITQIENPTGNLSSPNNIIISPNELKTKWKLFTSKLIKIDVTLKIINNTVPDFFPNEIIINCDNDFITESIQNKKELIQQQLNSFFGTTIKIACITQSTQSSPTHDTSSENIQQSDASNPSDTNPTNSSKIDVDRYKEKHPIETKIMQKFNAVEIR